MTDPASAVQCSPPGLAWLPQHWPSHTLQEISSGALPASQISSLAPAIPQVEVEEVEEVVLTVAGLTGEVWPWGGGGPSSTAVQQARPVLVLLVSWQTNNSPPPPHQHTGLQGQQEITLSVFTDQTSRSASLLETERQREREREKEPMMVPRLSAHLVV